MGSNQSFQRKGKIVSLKFRIFFAYHSLAKKCENLCILFRNFASIVSRTNNAKISGKNTIFKKKEKFIKKDEIFRIQGAYSAKMFAKIILEKISFVFAFFASFIFIAKKFAKNTNENSCIFLHFFPKRIVRQKPQFKLKNICLVSMFNEK